MESEIDEYSSKVKRLETICKELFLSKNDIFYFNHTFIEY